MNNIYSSISIVFLLVKFIQKIFFSFSICSTSNTCQPAHCILPISCIFTQLFYLPTFYKTHILRPKPYSPIFLILSILSIFTKLLISISPNLARSALFAPKKFLELQEPSLLLLPGSRIYLPSPSTIE